jgi:predicted DNA-binding transcriptional regulator YafY
MLGTTVRLRLAPMGRRLLPHLVDPDAARRALAAADPPDDDGWVALDLEVESEEVAATQLAGLGDAFEVVAPPELRARMADVGRAMAARHES